MRIAPVVRVFKLNLLPRSSILYSRLFHVEGGIIGNRMYVLGGYERELGQTVGIWSADLEPAFRI